MEEEDLSKAPLRLPKKASKVKNKAPANLQITAEQLLREAKERELEIVPPAPKQHISDPEELATYRRKRRQQFEDEIRKNRMVMQNWIKYAKWEEAQQELQRARSIFERGLDCDHRSIPVWLQYAEMEMRNKQVNHARNVWDRAVTILPRANQFWLKYTYMEEVLANIPGARVVFERWMEWEPPEQGWQTYINFELRYKEIERARAVWQRFLHIHHEANNWIRYARFEERQGFTANARQVYERAMEFFGDENIDEKLLIAFARFEEGQKEHERARVIYRYGLDNLPKERTEEIYKHYAIHEKKYGEKAGIETVVVSKRRHKYEEEIAANALNYDAWFDYVRLLEAESVDIDETRDVYERAISNIPPEQDKRFWRRYIYLWINYAVYEELVAKDVDKTREVYKACLDLLPHKKFTFAKVWIMYAHFEVRQKNLTQARKILGSAIGRCPKDKLFRGYIDMELQLREFDRCRILYEKFLEFAPENCTTWIKFAELETLLGDSERARAIYELAVAQPALDMPEILWKSYVDFEISQEEYERARGLYRRLLQRTRHVKVWLSYAQFELLTGERDSRRRARDVYQKANKAMAETEGNEERLMLLEAWLAFEREQGDAGSLAAVQKEMPKRVKKRRQVQTADGADAGWEEYYDYIFPTDQSNQASLKLLELAKKWKKTKAVDDDEAGETEATVAAAPSTATTTTTTAAPEATSAENTPADKDSAGKDSGSSSSDSEPEAKKKREGDSDTDLGSSSSSSDSDDSDEDEAKAPAKKKARPTTTDKRSSPRLAAKKASPPAAKKSRKR